MSLRRFDSPSRRDDATFHLDLGDDAREYTAEQSPVDTVRDVEEAPPYDLFAIWKDLAEHGEPRPAHEATCWCIRCRGWLEGHGEATETDHR